jgi:hypothetical protein
MIKSLINYSSSDGTQHHHKPREGTPHRSEGLGEMIRAEDAPQRVKNMKTYLARGVRRPRTGD